jgi:hypothetical protein
MSTARIRAFLRSAGLTGMDEIYGEIIVCQWAGRGHRWGHPACGAYGYHPERDQAREGARVHMTGCDRRRSIEDRRISPDALLFSLVRPTDTGWQVIDEPPPAPRPVP